MAAEYRFTCPLANGLHARPASLLADVVRPFRARVTISKVGGAAADMLSVLSVVGLDVQAGDECLVLADGEDAAAALASLRMFVEERLVAADEPAPGPAPAGAEARSRLPVALRRLEIQHSFGRAVCGGIGIGRAVIVSGLSLCPEALCARPGALESEVQSVRHAIGLTRDDLQRRAALAGRGMAGDLLRAHAAIAEDPALRGAIEQRVRGGATAAQAVVAAAEDFAGRLRGAQSAYIRDRAVDVIDVCMQMLDHLTGGGGGSARVALAEPSVVFADALTANQLLQMDRGMLRGLVLGGVGATSHTVILARSFRIPTVIDVRNSPSLTSAGTRVIVDGEGGVVLTQMHPAVERYYGRELRAHERSGQRLRSIAQGQARTTDGVGLEVGANASTPGEVENVIAHGADGVGLLRTELLFLDRATAPTEEEQFEAYSAVVKAAAGRPVIIRTFDIGGDKPAAYLRIPEEENPFLGVRGLRLYHSHPEVLSTQLRAILRASALGPVKIMAPMIATPEEAAWFGERVRAERRQLREQGVAVTEQIPIGIMLEIPAVAMVMDQLSGVVDFFSIGTNDLCQYWMAVDRGNPGVASLYNPRQPSFLRLLRAIVREAGARGKWIGVCGEMAGRRENLPLMIALGLDEISVAPGEVSTLKALVRTASAAACAELLDAACDCSTPAQVEALIGQSPWRSAAPCPVVAGELIAIGSDAQSKEEAIQEAVDLLYASGRAEQPRVVEEAVWAREQTYSTGLGFGFAIPHCKSEAVVSPSLAVVKLGSPVEWGSMDGQPVEVVMLLVVPASDASGSHMKVFASLARRLMHEEFRDRMRAAASAEAVEGCLREELGLS